jgi:hypothetical protein
MKHLLCRQASRRVLPGQRTDAGNIPRWRKKNRLLSVVCDERGYDTGELQMHDARDMRHAFLISLMALCLFGAAPPAIAASPLRVQLATGAQYSSGDYDEASSTSALVIPFYMRVSRSNWSLQLSAPWVSVDGPQALTELLDDNGGLGSNSGSGGGGGASSGSDDDIDDEPDDDDLPPDPTGDTASRSTSGAGDVSLTAGYSFDRIAGSPIYLDLRGRVRFPTGSRRAGLGSGTTDYAARTEIGYAGRRGGVYLGGGRRFLGEVAGVDRVDGWQASAGAWWVVSPHSTLGVNYDWRNASVRGGEAPRFVEAYAAWYLSDVWKLEINGGAGLSAASPDYAAGFTLTWRGSSTRGRR